VPEALNFCQLVLSMTAPIDFFKTTTSAKGKPIIPGLFPLPDYIFDLENHHSVKEFLRLTKKDLETAHYEPLQFRALFGTYKKDSPFVTYFSSPSFRLSLAVMATVILGKFMKLYNELPAFSEVFEGIPVLIKPFSEQVQDSVSKEIFLDTLKLSEGLLASAGLKRKPLRLQDHKPVPIKTSIPRFHEKYVSFFFFLKKIWFF